MTILRPFHRWILVVLVAASVLGGFSVSHAAVFGDFANGIDLSADNLLRIVVGLACWFSRIAILVLTGSIVFYGLQAMASRDNPTAYAAAIKSFNYALVGALVIFGAYTIIATVAHSVGAEVSRTPLHCF